VIVKQANPCGVGKSAGAIEEAYATGARLRPQLSAYGGIVVPQPAGVSGARERIAEQFVEVLFAPGATTTARVETLRRKEALRILESTERRSAARDERDYRRVLGGLLAQDRDGDVEDREGMIVVCGVAEAKRDWGDLLFAWRVLQARDLQRDRDCEGPPGQSASEPGRWSRVDAVRIAGREGPRARPRPRGRRDGLGRILPFPGRPADRARGRVSRGSSSPAVRSATRTSSPRVNATGAAMVFTGRRHFRH
jgi:phosphoribosylaminoimidazolecarboxamide formyltransferase/IMP cyclohydrolase